MFNGKNKALTFIYDDEDYTVENALNLELAKKHKQNYILIDGGYSFEIKTGDVRVLRLNYCRSN